MTLPRMLIWYVWLLARERDAILRLDDWPRYRPTADEELRCDALDAEGARVLADAYARAGVTTLAKQNALWRRSIEALSAWP